MLALPLEKRIICTPPPPCHKFPAMSPRRWNARYMKNTEKLVQAIAGSYLKQIICNANVLSEFVVLTEC